MSLSGTMKVKVFICYDLSTMLKHVYQRDGTENWEKVGYTLMPGYLEMSELCMSPSCNA
jgi:hypothetical protein